MSHRVLIDGHVITDLDKAPSVTIARGKVYLTFESDSGPGSCFDDLRKHIGSTCMVDITTQPYVGTSRARRMKVIAVTTTVKQRGGIVHLEPAEET